MGFLVFLPFFSAVIVVMILFYICYAILKFILYVFKSLGLLRIAKKENYKYPYVVWIPFVSNYILGKYCMDKKKGIIYLILSIIKFLIMIIFFMLSEINALYDALYTISLIYSIFYFVIDMIVMNKFYKKVYKTPELFTILSIISFGLLNSIFIYTTRIRKITKIDLN